MDDDYRDYGSRREYLESLADEYGVSMNAVLVLADTLGPNEDFDGLISELEDLVLLKNEGIAL